MKTHQQLFLISIFLCSSLYAAPNVIKALRDELNGLTQYARSMVYDYQNGKPVHSLVAHYLDERNYTQIKASLSIEQRERIFTGAQLVDYTFQLANNPQSIQACFANFCNEIISIRQSVCNDTAVVKRAQKDYRAIEKNDGTTKQFPAAPNIIVTKEIDDELSRVLQGISEGDHQQIEDAMAALENPVPAVLELLMDNKGKIAMGLVTLYAVLAKANDWPPYDKKPKPVQATWRSWLSEQVNEIGETILQMGG